MSVNFSAARWINPPAQFEIHEESVKITTDPNTDFWQRSYYGFRNDNAPALLLESNINFSFTVQASFEYRERFDQSGVIIYQDCNNWFKASVEFENEDYSRLGSVVTTQGYSDWATTDIGNTDSMWYRLHRRGPDFLIESSLDGIDFEQMRVFHLHCLGKTSPEMGKLNPPAPPTHAIHFGLYACSPVESSFEATFDQMKLEDCLWKAHGD